MQEYDRFPAMAGSPLDRLKRMYSTRAKMLFHGGGILAVEAGMLESAAIRYWAAVRRAMR